MAATTSLRLTLLERLLPAMLLLLLAGAGTAYWVAHGSATKAYDRSLYDIALAIAGQLQVSDGQLQLSLTPQAREVLLTDKYDRTFYAVHETNGRLIDGNPELPLPIHESWRTLGSEGRSYYDGVIDNEPVRLAALRRDIGGHQLTILAAETTVKRNALVREILLGMLLPELMLALVSLMVVLIGIRTGLRPVTTLSQQLAVRSPNDLRPLDVDVPDEMATVQTEINGLLARLDRSLSSQRHFVSDAAHQLRTPIAALQAQVEALIQEGGGNSQMTGILSATRRLAHLVDQLLALARAEPAQPQATAAVNLENIAKSAAEAWLPKAIARNIDLGFELAPACITGNTLLLEELLGNLVDNALRHTPAGGQITVACGESDDGAWLSVEDSGSGIAEAERERVFERFYRAPASPGDGSGLGLAIVREIARQHGGEVSIGESTALGGALITARFAKPATA